MRMMKSIIRFPLLFFLYIAVTAIIYFIGFIVVFAFFSRNTGMGLTAIEKAEYANTAIKLWFYPSLILGGIIIYKLKKKFPFGKV